MDKKIENQINTIGAKIDIIESINNALTASLCGIDNFSEKDSCNYAYLLESKIKDLKIRQEKLIKDLKI